MSRALFKDVFRPKPMGGSELSREPLATARSLGVMRKAVWSTGRGLEGDCVFGDVRVNFSTMEVTRRGEPVALTALQFKVLRYMLQNPRRVISRGELLDEVWGYNHYPTTRTVDNQIAQLRKKLERERSAPVHLRTVQGFGYKFQP